MTPAGQAAAEAASAGQGLCCCTAQGSGPGMHRFLSSWMSRVQAAFSLCWAGLPPPPPPPPPGEPLPWPPGLPLPASLPPRWPPLHAGVSVGGGVRGHLGRASLQVRGQPQAPAAPCCSVVQASSSVHSIQARQTGRRAPGVPATLALLGCAHGRPPAAVQQQALLLPPRLWRRVCAAGRPRWPA